MYSIQFTLQTAETFELSLLLITMIVASRKSQV